MRCIPKPAEGRWEGGIFLLFLPITPRAPLGHASRDWGRVSLTGVVNVRSWARSSTEVPIINGKKQETLSGIH